MTFTNRELLNAVDAMSNLNASGKFGFAVAKNLRRMRAEAQDYIQFREDCLLKYGQPVEDKPGQYKIPPESVVAYNKELSSVGNETVEVDVFKIDEETFIAQEFDSNQMADLIWMVKDENED